MLIEEIRGLVFQSIRRSANSLADHMVNYGVDNLDIKWDTCWQEVTCPSLKEACNQLAAKDLAAEGQV